MRDKVMKRQKIKCGIMIILNAIYDAIRDMYEIIIINDEIF